MRSISELCDLSGKVAIVTGSGGGLGYGIADRFAEAGAAVVINDINPASVSRAVEQLAKPGRKLASVVADISQRADVNRVLGVALEAFGRVDILVNNAGIFTRQPVLEMTDEAWDGVIAVNLRGAFLCSQVMGKQMVAQGQGGKIVNMSSRAGLMAAKDDLIAYATTKAGLIHMTRVLARALAPHQIRVNALAPVSVDTGKPRITSTTTLDQIPLGRLGRVDDVALATLFLVSDMSDFVTGITIPIDGGAVFAT